jgi:hypothetical protein
MIVLRTRVNNGTVSTTVQNEIKAFLNMYEGKEVEIVLKKARSKRSDLQNRYYWGCVVEIVRQALKELGHRLDKDEVHYFLREKFNYKELVNESTGESLKLPSSTTTLTKTEFAEYIERIAQWSAEFLNVAIPEPNEQLELIS